MRQPPESHYSPCGKKRKKQEPQPLFKVDDQEDQCDHGAAGVGKPGHDALQAEATLGLSELALDDVAVALILCLLPFLLLA